MKCENCEGSGRVHLRPQKPTGKRCHHCVNGEIPAHRELWLCKVRGEDFAALLYGHSRRYYYDIAVGGWFIVDTEIEVEPGCRLVQHKNQITSLETTHHGKVE